MAGIEEEEEVKTLRGIEGIATIEAKEITNLTGTDPETMDHVSDAEKRAI